MDGYNKIVYRPLRVERGMEVVEVYVESPLDGMKGVWVELLSDTVIENNGFDNDELTDIFHILNNFRDLLYVDARNAAKKVVRALNMITIIFTLTGFIILYERVHRWNRNSKKVRGLSLYLMMRK